MSYVKTRLAEGTGEPDEDGVRSCRSSHETVAEVLGITQDFAKHLLRKSEQEDVQRVIEWAVTNDLFALRLQFDSRRPPRSQSSDAPPPKDNSSTAAATMDSETKSMILSRFSDVSTPLCPKGNNKAKLRKELRRADKKENKKSSNNLRYREGQVVSTKGGKWMHEAPKEEWDGGSRGKVKSKGKRGVGFTT